MIPCLKLYYIPPQTTKTIGKIFSTVRIMLFEVLTFCSKARLLYNISNKHFRMHLAIGQFNFVQIKFDIKFCFVCTYFTTPIPIFLP